MTDSRALLFVGGSSAIAIASLRRLDEPGTVLLCHCHRSRDALDRLVGELRHARAVILTADLADSAAVDGLADAVERELVAAALPSLDGIVFAAAHPPGFSRFTKKPWDEFAAQLDIAVRAPATLLARLLPAMAKRRRGRVVFLLSSVTLGRPPAGFADYVTSKYAQLGLMQALAAEYAGKNLQINAVSPTMVETPLLRNYPRIVVEKAAADHPLGRNATPEDIAPTICFLLSDAAGFVHGVNFPVTGGA